MSTADNRAFVAAFAVLRETSRAIPSRKRVRDVSSEEQRQIGRIKDAAQDTEGYGKRVKRAAARMIARESDKKGLANGKHE
jgi:hypothetical protein